METPQVLISEKRQQILIGEWGKLQSRHSAINCKFRHEKHVKGTPYQQGTYLVTKLAPGARFANKYVCTRQTGKGVKRDTADYFFDVGYVLKTVTFKVMMDNMVGNDSTKK